MVWSLIFSPRYRSSLPKSVEAEPLAFVVFHEAMKAGAVFEMLSMQGVWNASSASPVSFHLPILPVFIFVGILQR